jgi:hypothetical protein
MKIMYPCAMMVVIFFGCVKNEHSESSTSAKTILLQQLKTTHTVKEWFVPVNIALEGVTPEQAMWRDSSGNHSIGQLTYHLLFWNQRQLAKFNGLPEGDSPGSNEETFSAFNKDQWERTVSRLDSVLTALEKSFSEAEPEKLKSWYSTFANISTHNAYHTGQILYFRKLQGSWNPEKGVQ